MSEATNDYDRIAHFKEHYLSHFEQITDPEYLVDELTFLDFFTAPASAHHHLSYKGGLYDHSCHVTDTLIDLTNNNHLIWARPESPYIIGMFHDLCKCDAYKPIYENKQMIDGNSRFTIVPVLVGYDYNKEQVFKGHGDKSVMLASTLISLTLQEVFCIRYHMGAFTDKEEWGDYTRTVYNCPNVLWTHQADMIATHITEGGM